jgi:hypothetical protein
MPISKVSISGDSVQMVTFSRAGDGSSCGEGTSSLAVAVPMKRREGFTITCKGPLTYNMQGPIDVLPRKLKNSAGAFQGAWTEGGTFENLERALHFVTAWILEREEVDELPERCVRYHGI